LAHFLTQFLYPLAADGMVSEKICEQGTEATCLAGLVHPDASHDCSATVGIEASTPHVFEAVPVCVFLANLLSVGQGKLEK
jgi:hypothetical protein